MTEEEFFAYTQLHPDQVNIWYGTGGPPYTLKAITIPVLDNNNPPQDRSRLLENIQQITLPLSTGDNVTVNEGVSIPNNTTIPSGSVVSIEE